MKGCIVNGHSFYDVSEVENLGGTEFRQRCLNNMPKSLFKYFSNTYQDGRNFSFEALETNRVFMQSPSEYNDPYDSYLKVDAAEFYTAKVKYYLDLAKVTYSDCDDFEKLFAKLLEYAYQKLLPDIWILLEENFLELVDVEEIKNESRVYLSCMVFEAGIRKRILSSQKSIPSLDDAIIFTLKEEFDYVQKLTYSSFKISCFTQRKDNVLMWAHYANNHKGFCLEYDIAHDIAHDIATFENNHGKLFPVIYCNYLSDVSQEVISHNLDRLDYQGINGLYTKGLLRKTLDWHYEEEWRLIDAAREAYLEEFFKIKKVYLGCKMPEDEQKKIMKYCSENNIQCALMTLDDSEYKMIESKTEL